MKYLVTFEIELPPDYKTDKTPFTKLHDLDVTLWGPEDIGPTQLDWTRMRITTADNPSTPLYSAAS